MQMVTKAAVQPSDAQLVAASRFDGVHFVTVFDRHACGVHEYLSCRLGDAAGGLHLGDAFAAAYAARRHFRSAGDSARPWLLGVATGVIRRQWRMEQGRLRSCADRADVVGAGSVAEHLQHLAARDRDIVLLAAWEDQEPGAIAMALDLPDGAVATRLAALAVEIGRLAPRSPDAHDDGAEGLGRLRRLRPARVAPDPARIDEVRRDLQVLTGQTDRSGSARSTESVAAEHEQHRRWLARPGASLVNRRR